MKIVWTPNAKASGYEVCYSTNSSFAGGKTIRVANAQTAKEVIGGLRTGEKYYVKVRSYSVSGNTTYYSAWSEVQSIVHAKVELCNVIDGVQVTWTAVKDASEYRIYRKQFGEKDGERVAVVKDATSYIDKNVENGTRYCYYVVMQLPTSRATTNVAAVMYLEAPQIDKLWNN